MLKKVLALILALCLLGSFACAEEPAGAVEAADSAEPAGTAEAAGRDAETEEILSKFTIVHGSRASKRVCITIDDCTIGKKPNLERAVGIAKEYGVRFTVFPLVKTGFLEEKYRDFWQGILDLGFEIGCHGYQHLHLGSFDYWTLMKRLGRWQEELDKTLGYHYQVRWMRAPMGTIANGRKMNDKQVTSALQRFGFEHVVRWDVSSTTAKNAKEKVKNGSILLFHPNTKDVNCIEELVPWLLEEGYELVTLSEMFGYPPPETSEELYVYDRANYEDK